MGAVNPSDHRNEVASPLGSLLKLKREAAGLNITQMARQLGMSRPYLSRLEQGLTAHPSPKMLFRIAKRLNMGVEDLYAITGCILPADLPSLGPYLRAKHPDWPESIITELVDFRDFLKQKYSLR